ncbi:hypothetical protein QVD17_03631 [Tagetes erecta]|uniref:Uncharacterized protein n=1 Tax=Tagetes erecta TaxID=13708 RepID=A0AAD8LEY8_TARER|nr:hypothetical protein QVD17_03631 [Tagetes erecta]
MLSATATISDANLRSDFPISFSPTKRKRKRSFISPSAMKSSFTRLTPSLSRLIVFIFLVHISLAGADAFDYLTVHREINRNWPMFDCPQCMSKKEQDNRNSLAAGNHKVGKDIDIIVTYTDTSGAIKIRTVKSKDLSASWVWQNPIDDDQSKEEDSKSLKDQPETRFVDSNEHSSSEHAVLNEQPHKTSSPMHPAKLKRRALRQERRDRRTAELIQVSQKGMTQMEEAAIERAKMFDTSVKGKYSIWRKEYESPNSDSMVKLMRDQIIMAKAYASIAKAKNETGIYDSLIQHSKRNQQAIEKATSDSELVPSAVDWAKEMGHILSLAKDQFYDCIIMARKLRVMLQSTEAKVDEVKKKILRQLESSRMQEYYFKAHQASSLTAGSDNLKNLSWLAKYE